MARAKLVLAKFGAALLVAGLTTTAADAMPRTNLAVAAAALDMTESVACVRDGFRGVRSYRNCFKPTVSADAGMRWKDNAKRRRAGVQAANKTR
jgi:hypothetical protein